MPDPFPTNKSVQRSQNQEPVPQQELQGPWRNLTEKQPLARYEDSINYEPGHVGAVAMDKLYGKHNWTKDSTRFADVEPGERDPFGNPAKSKMDILVSPDGDQHRAQAIEASQDEANVNAPETEPQVLHNPDANKEE